MPTLGPASPIAFSALLNPSASSITFGSGLIQPKLSCLQTLKSTTTSLTFSTSPPPQPTDSPTDFLTNLARIAPLSLPLSYTFIPVAHSSADSLVESAYASLLSIPITHDPLFEAYVASFSFVTWIALLRYEASRSEVTSWECDIRCRNLAKRGRRAKRGCVGRRFVASLLAWNAIFEVELLATLRRCQRQCGRRFHRYTSLTHEQNLHATRYACRSFYKFSCTSSSNSLTWLKNAHEWFNPLASYLGSIYVYHQFHPHPALPETAPSLGTLTLELTFGIFLYE
ncbi:hypothetical protein TL16_g11720 [Triparma laevis f. inornata]|uniref:C2H2-type domain-containing protein n=1 Tax=Triparma laevis f. inornata TaxID=1714386 RepID=A0A9W7BPE4_9STRA|nr:hypothetical protein TL16_g11720 [Triparma laevis f. inornata]